MAAQDLHPSENGKAVMKQDPEVLTEAPKAEAHYPKGIEAVFNNAIGVRDHVSCGPCKSILRSIDPSLRENSYD